ncbi:unnamed protein product [Prunus armeniaca]|uniref:Uncharacterized protein n=1 Tax=Prunus armeniaca TaxID=36596 RepID=A0A6J5V6D5_PRUAR|nr:unnamed protein product [Prunus armeniaca]
MDREKGASINSPGVPKALSKVDNIIQGKGEEDEGMLPEEKALKPYTLHCQNQFPEDEAVIVLVVGIPMVVLGIGGEV